MTAPTKLTQDELNDLGQKLLTLTPGGSEYFSRDGNGFKVDVFACVKFLEHHRNARFEMAKIEAAQKKDAEAGKNTPPGPPTEQITVIEGLIGYGNRNNISDYNMAKAICWRIFNWSKEEEGGAK